MCKTVLRIHNSPCLAFVTVLHWQVCIFSLSKCQIHVAHARCQRPITCHYSHSLLALCRFIEKVILQKDLRNINEYKWNIRSIFFSSSHLLEIFFLMEALLDKDLTAGTRHMSQELKHTRERRAGKWLHAFSFSFSHTFFHFPLHTQINVHKCDQWGFLLMHDLLCRNCIRSSIFYMVWRLCIKHTSP